MSDPLNIEIHSLKPTAIIELFTLTLPDASVLRFHAGTNGLTSNVVWQGTTYVAAPVQATGFDITTTGPMPTPEFSVSNIQGAITTYLLEQGDILGSVLVRKRTFQRFLDAVNFPGGVNPNADPTKHYADDIYEIEQKVSEDILKVTFRCSSSIDAQGIMLPRRVMTTNTCYFRYRGPDCGYAGDKYFNAQDEPESLLEDDVCGKRVYSCKLRFQTQLIVALPVTADSVTHLFTAVAHGLVNGNRITFTATTMPGLLSTSVSYFVVNADADTFQVAGTLNGPPISFTTNGLNVVLHFDGTYGTLPFGGFPGISRLPR
jgi:lambda family phage minor tail protein L